MKNNLWLVITIAAFSFAFGLGWFESNRIGDWGELKIRDVSKGRKVPKKVESLTFNYEILNKITNEKDKQYFLSFYTLDDNVHSYLLKKNLNEKVKLKLYDILVSIDHPAIKATVSGGEGGGYGGGGEGGGYGGEGGGYQ